MDSLIYTTNIGSEYSKEILDKDLDKDSDFKYLPILQYNYPRDYYSGSAGVKEMEFNDLGIIGVTFLIGNEEKFKNLFDEKTDEVYQDFLTILYVDPSIKEFRNKVSSRNFPDYYLGQGYIYSKNGKVNYASVIRHTGEAIAIINEKVFNLTENGKTIILIPLNNGSLYFVQIKTKFLNNKEVSSFYRELLKSYKIKHLISSAVTGK